MFITFLASLFLNTIFLLESLKFYIFFSFSSRGKVHQMCHPCDPIQSDRSLYFSATLPLHVRESLQNNPYSFPFILTSGGAAATLAIKQLIYLTWKLMIAKDSSSGDNKGRGNPEKIELDWSALEQTNGPVKEGNSSTSSFIAHVVNPDFCLILCRKWNPMEHDLNMKQVLSSSKVLAYSCLARQVSPAQWTSALYKGFPSTNLNFKKLLWAVRFITVRSSFCHTAIGHHDPPKTVFFWAYGTFLKNLFTWHLKRLSSLKRSSSSNHFSLKRSRFT